jgi:hypothetical protein
MGLAGQQLVAFVEPAGGEKIRGLLSQVFEGAALE